jgi:hypothetical protein
MNTIQATFTSYGKNLAHKNGIQGVLTAEYTPEQLEQAIKNHVKGDEQSGSVSFISVMYPDGHFRQQSCRTFSLPIGHEWRKGAK